MNISIHFICSIFKIRELEDIKITNQINIICTEQHNKYLANINTSEQENGSDKSIDGSKNPSVNVANRKKNE